MTWTPRQRMLAALQRRTPDRIPWFPRLEIWYEANRNAGTLPERYRGLALDDIYRRLGMGLQGRHPVKRHVFQTELDGVEVIRDELEDGIRVEYRTPFGRVSNRFQTSSELRNKGVIALEVEHLIKSVEDYPPVEYILQHTCIKPCYDSYLSYEQELGEEGIPFVYIGQDPMNRILQELIGYNQAYFHLSDHPDRVEHLYLVLCEHYQRLQQVVLDSPAKLVMHGQHFDSTMTPLRIFRKYMTPYYQPFAEKMHARGKWLACHADADTSRLMPEVLACGFDVLDCFVTAPMVPLSMPQARAVFGNQVVIWGGVPSVLLESSFSEIEFRQAVLDLFSSVAPGEAFILGIADNAMPESSIERIELLSRVVEQAGEVPLDLGRVRDVLEI